MTRLIHRLNRMLNRANARFRNARPGSILILVIALLVLMALIGTAFISTARIERYSATQNTYNTQVDLLIQGVLGQADGPLVRKVQGSTGNFRQAVSSTVSAGDQYNPWESPITDLYLADRVPTAISTSVYGWGNITAPVNASTLLTSGQFEAPYAIDASGRPIVGGVTYTVRNNVIPTSISIAQPDGSVRVYPAFSGITPLQQATTLQVVNSNGTVSTGASTPLTVVAADTDGDGIADAGFIRIPMGQTDGTTYYGALRIIDNLAAINASVAMEPFTTVASAGSPVTPQTTSYAVPGDFFPTNINLRDLVAGNSDTLTALNQYRFGTAAWSSPIADYSDTGPAARTDFVFNTQYEAAWSQLGCRVNNPGYLNSSTKYQAVPIDEGMNLAYHGGLANINAPAPSPVLETYLPNSVYSASVRVAPFAPNATGAWYGTLYNYGGTPVPSLRPLLVVRNPLSSFAPSYFTGQGFWSAQTYSFGSRVQYTDPNTGYTRSFVCIQPTAQPPMVGNVYNNAYWAAMPWASAPTKINANTGTFGQLWTAYWSVMQDSPDSSGNYPAAPASTVVQTDVSTQQFRNPIRNSTPPTTIDPATKQTIPQLTRTQMIQLRAALAAVNTIDMRDGDEDITSRTIALTAASGAPLYATVYGAEKQPYVTEVLIDYEPNETSPSTPVPPYVAIELYNPHPTPIVLTNWKLAYITAGTPITLTEIGDLTATFMKATPARTPAYINPGERIVLQNQITAPTNLSTYWAQQTPPVVPITVEPAIGATNSNLEAAVGHELVLLRPRMANGTWTANSAPENTFVESTTTGGTTVANLYDLVPLDNIDLTGVAFNPKATAPAAGMQPPYPQRYRYARANKITADSASAAWHCVYPGPYTLANSTGVTSGTFAFRHAGLLQVLAQNIPPSTANPQGTPADNGWFTVPKGKFVGAPTATSGMTAPFNVAVATYDTRPLQINNRDYAGPNRPYYDLPGPPPPATPPPPNGLVAPLAPGMWSANPMNLPLGGFARSGDLLQVPFIGSYKITTAPETQAAPNPATLEMNSITMDSVYAQYQQPTYNVPLSASPFDIDSTTLGAPAFHNEQIGHFCPMTAGSTDFNDDPGDKNFATFKAGWTYHWAKRLFDYLDVRTPQDGYLPNVDPALTSAGSSGDPSFAGSNLKYPASSPMPISGNPNVLPLSTYGPQQLQGRLDNGSTEGMININTANWKVLAAVPWFTPGEDNSPPGQYLADNATIAQAIVAWRDFNNSGAYPNAPHTDYGPFRSIFDLLKVPTFQTFVNKFWVTSGGAGTPGGLTNQFGDLSPFFAVWNAANVAKNAPAYPNNETDSIDHVYGDVKTRFLGLMRISNLITTRSDSFTVYAQVQGWQNIGTTVPGLVATRRAAAFLDRSQVVPLWNATTSTATPTPMGVINVPND
jgi:hypothetical protein